jgi:serine/threonine-protein kinase HipA
MKRRLGVYLGANPQLVGHLYYNRDGARESATFEYDNAWLSAPATFPIDPALPLVRGPQFHKALKDGSVFHPAIADTEPDGWGMTVIRRDHAKRRAAARAAGEDLPPLDGALEYLLSVDDACRIGALRFQDEAGEFWRPAATDGHRTTPPLLELGALLAASTAVERHTETAADLEYLRGRGTSLGGLRPKCNIIDDDGTLAIAKFPSVGDARAVTIGEVLALHLAAAAGINAAQARIVPSDEQSVALIRRFDRTADGNRIFAVSAATLMGVERGAPGDHTYAEMVDAIRQYGAAAQDDIVELFRRIAFSILITNVDDHLWNHSFLHTEAGQWRLSPAFDVNPFPERVRELKTWITEDTGPAMTIEALLSAAPYFGVTASDAARIIGEVERAVARWRAVGAGLGLSDADLAAYADAFEHEERAFAQHLASGAR